MKAVNKFMAVGTAPNGEQYQCNFSVVVDLSMQPTQAQMNEAVQIAMRQFKEYHPTGQIIGRQDFQIQ